MFGTSVRDHSKFDSVAVFLRCCHLHFRLFMLGFSTSKFLKHRIHPFFSTGIRQTLQDRANPQLNLGSSFLFWDHGTKRKSGTFGGGFVPRLH